jgi:hypothetical protein
MKIEKDIQELKGTNYIKYLLYILTHQTVKSTSQMVKSTHLRQADKWVFNTWS